MRIFNLLKTSRLFTKKRAMKMNPNGAPNAEPQKRHSKEETTVEDSVATRSAKCTTLYAHNAVSRLRFRLGPTATGRFIAGIAISQEADKNKHCFDS